MPSQATSPTPKSPATHTFTHTTLSTYHIMNHFTFDILTYQRRFFVMSILIEALTQCLLSATAHYLDRTINTDNWITSWDTIQNIVEAITMLYICIYGIYLCRKGYLKKYATYAFLTGCLFAIIMPMITDVPDTPYGAIISSGLMCIYFAIVIISIKSSVMTGRMKWCLSFGFIGLWIIMGAVAAIMDELTIQTNDLGDLSLPVIIHHVFST